MQIAIIGMGVVGKHMQRDIQAAGHTDIPYDINGNYYSKDTVNRSDAAFVCVGTPMGKDGSCDLSAVEDVFSWLTVPAIIRSTVPPGTTDKYNAVFVPEFIGEGVNAPYNQMKQPPFLIIGGKNREWAGNILAKLYNSECEFIYTDAVTAETAKYAENYFLALKVSWANEMYDICKKVGADFGQMMSAVTHDYRIGRSHTHVYPDKRGWSGRCLPKDLNALLKRVGKAPLLQALIETNHE